MGVIFGLGLKFGCIDFGIGFKFSFISFVYLVMFILFELFCKEGILGWFFDGSLGFVFLESLSFFRVRLFC